MGRNGVGRRIVAAAAVVLAGMALGACGLFGSSQSQTQAVGEPGVPGSIIAADTHLGSPTPCYFHVMMPARLCSAWKSMPANLQPPNAQAAAQSVTFYPVSETLHVPYAIVQMCVQAAPGAAWVPRTVQGLSSGLGGTSTLPSHFSCVPYLDPSGGLAPITIVFGIFDLVVIVGAVVFVANRRSASRVPAPVGV